MKIRAFQFKPFSRKQRQMLNWWTENSPVNDYDGIIAEGSIRSGKSISMSLSFAIWAMETYEFQNFGMAGKTIGSFRRNVLSSMILMLKSRGYKTEYKRSDNILIISKNDIDNYFYIFGGKDERSQDLVQGITLAGMYFDEVALMPESFVNQATGRCSVDGAKLWFNCNPEYPLHWFKTEWIDKRKEKNLLLLHFTMDDNLSLSQTVRERYKKMYTGIFYERFILGLWALAEGLIYAEYQQVIVDTIPDTKPLKTAFSIDYGTMNAFACLQWELHGDRWIATKGYYYSGRDKGVQKTDNEYLADMESTFAEAIEDIRKKREISLMVEKMEVIIDPSAASFIALLRKTDWAKVRKADNDVLNGIRETATCMSLKKFGVYAGIKEWQTEAGGYVWDDKQSGEDKPVKVNDHYMDATRYFVHTKHLYKEKQQYDSPYRLGGR